MWWMHALSRVQSRSRRGGRVLCTHLEIFRRFRAGFIPHLSPEACLVCQLVSKYVILSTTPHNRPEMIWLRILESFSFFVVNSGRLHAGRWLQLISLLILQIVLQLFHPMCYDKVCFLVCPWLPSLSHACLHFCVYCPQVCRLPKSLFIKQYLEIQQKS